MKFPRVLILAMGRINESDTSNNGLLLRNLFAKFPKENTAQIYSGGSNSDEGFFGGYYQLRYKDRRWGRLFFKMKNESQLEISKKDENVNSDSAHLLKGWFQYLGKRFLINTGFYEIIFHPRLSNEMLNWVENFKPDIIFAQGYNLAFTLLPLKLSKYYKLPIAYYPTDDWSNICYIPELGYHGILPKLTRKTIQVAVSKLVKSATVRIAFNSYMKEEYFKRFGVSFNVLMQGDDSARYEAISPHRLANKNDYWIVCTGDFDHYRLPLLGDLDRACEILNAKGIKIQTTVFPAVQLDKKTLKINNFKYINFDVCPSHDSLVSVLRGADILFLPERFDITAPLIELSVSSKAHLFMFSGKPIVVYSDAITGIAKYAKDEGWAIVVDKQNSRLLANAIEKLITNLDVSLSLVDSANKVAMKNHNISKIQSQFYSLLFNSYRLNTGLDEMSQKITKES